MSKTNLEFRKIPSLRCQYEISTDGRYVRNVKSKKYCFTWRENGEYYFRIQDRKNRGEYLVCSILQACQECGISCNSKAGSIGTRNHENTSSIASKKSIFSRKVMVTLEKDTLSTTFESITQAATHIATQTQHPYEYIRRRMQFRRAHILGYKVSYRNAETVHR